VARRYETRVRRLDGRRGGETDAGSELTDSYLIMRMIVMKIWQGLAAVLVGVLLVSGCTSTPQESDGRLRVSAAFYPFQFVAERVGGDQVHVTNLTPPGAEPHDLELTPKEVAGLATDDLVVYQAGFQPAVDTAVEQAAPKRTVDAATFLHLAEAGSDGAGEPGSHQLDPHTWLDPTNLVLVAEHVRDALTAARPEAADAFAANASALIDDLTSLDADLHAELTGCRVTTVITTHAAFGYFAARYGLTQVGISGLEPDVEPSAARIAEVQRIARDEGVTTIFFETLASPEVANAIAGDLGLATDVFDPLEGITSASRGSNYLEVMRANGAAVRKANSCS